MPLPDAPDIDLVSPPVETPDAYHKHDCLAVLGRDPDRIEQLYWWVRKLVQNDIVIVEIERHPKNPIEALLHGYSLPVLRKRTR